jgi:hypothetical protein
MENKTYTKYNFHQHTFCVFKEVDGKEINDLKPNFKSKSGSLYFFNDQGVFRQSNHWGRAANCKWRLESANSGASSRNKIGFANWNSFHNDNEIDKLYFITVDVSLKTATYLHKNNEEYIKTAILRTASETTKRIKIIRNFFENESWAKHFDEVNIDLLRYQIIQKLIETNLSLQEIKSTIRNSL